MLRRTVGRFRHRPGRRALQPGSALPRTGDVVAVVGLGGTRSIAENDNRHRRVMGRDSTGHRGSRSVLAVKVGRLRVDGGMWEVSPMAELPDDDELLAAVRDAGWLLEHHAVRVLDAAEMRAEGPSAALWF